MCVMVLQLKDDEDEEQEQIHVSIDECLYLIKKSVNYKTMS